MTSDITDERLERILDSIETMVQSIEILAQKQSLDRETYKTDRETRDIVERRFVKLTEAAIDIGTVVCKIAGQSPPESNPGTMRTLEDLGILSATTADQMAKASRFRNVLAHTYGGAIDDDVVYDALQDLDRYRDFLSEVRTYLESIGAIDS
jgi:uncharacterized protein YutE (UPF0331/DUF86 family)